MKGVALFEWVEGFLGLWWGVGAPLDYGLDLGLLEHVVYFGNEGADCAWFLAAF